MIIKAKAREFHPGARVGDINAAVQHLPIWAVFEDDLLFLIQRRPPELVEGGLEGRSVDAVLTSFEALRCATSASE
jgi:hypothetical protein